MKILKIQICEIQINKLYYLRDLIFELIDSVMIYASTININYN